MNKLLVLAASSTFAFSLMVTPAQAQTVVEVAQSDEQFSALVDAVVAQDLAQTLSGEGPFTVFAPTNDAFAAIPGYVGNLLSENPALLTDILLYHVVAGELMASDVLAAEELTSLEGDTIAVSADDDGAYVDTATLIATDVDASNGVVHVIDSVLIPESVDTAIREAIRADLIRLIMELQTTTYTPSH